MEQKNLLHDKFKKILQAISDQRYPDLHFVKKGHGVPYPYSGIRSSHQRLGVFPASFNPPTITHVELIRRALQTFQLHEILLLASPRNADKTSYEATLEDRLQMLLQIFSSGPGVSIGVCSHPYFIDMLQAIQAYYPEGTEIYFIVGYDTLERVLDREGKYYPRYHKTYTTREEALKDLFTNSYFIVGGGKAPLNALKELLTREMDPDLFAKIYYLELPDSYPRATEVRERRKQGLSIEKLVPPEVQHYLEETGLYSRSKD
jgi:nicotinic acid mononucleotide adenylyltransferase